MAPRSGLSGSARIMRMSGPAFAAAEKHGKRADLKGPARAVVDVPPLTSTGLDLADLFAKHVEGAAIHKSGTKALHMLIQFPTELVDGEKPKRMLDLARRFGEEVFGDQAIFADRVDRDEKSRHVVDLFIAPKYQKRTKHSEKQAVSTSKHLKALAEKHGRAPTLRGQGQALQDAFAAFLVAEGFSKVQRGKPKVLPGPDRLEPEELEAERLADMEASLLYAFQPPSPFDGLRPDRYQEAQQKRIAKAAAPILAEASKTAAERVRRIEAEKLTAAAEKRAREAEWRAQERLQRTLETFREMSRGQFASLKAQVETLTRDLNQQIATRERAQQEARGAVSDAAEAKKAATAAKRETAGFQSFLASTRETLKEMLGDNFRLVADRINADWRRHPDNPERQASEEQETSYRSGPSPG